MQNDPRAQAERLVDDCTLLLRRARVVVHRRSEHAAEPAELERALALVGEALAQLRVLTGERGPREGRIPEGSVGGIVSRLLGRRRSPRRGPRESIVAVARREPPRQEELLHGHSKIVPIPDLLSFLRMQGKTGLLRVVLPSEVISIHFERGTLAAAISSNSPPGCLLGEILVEQGAIHSKQLEAFLVHYTTAHGRLGTALELVDLVTEAQLRTALTCQIQRLFHRLLVAEEAIFEFRDGEPEELHPETRLDVINLLLESARQADEANARR